MNRTARCRLFLRANLACIAGRFTGSRHHDWKQRRRSRHGLAQFAPLQCATPLENLVRVHTVRTSHQCHTGTGFKRQFRYLPLLRHRSKSAWAAPSYRSLLINHDDIVALKPEVMPEGNSGRLPATQHRAQSDHQQFIKIMQTGIAAARVFQTLPTCGKLLQEIFTGHGKTLLRGSPFKPSCRKCHCWFGAIPNAIALGANAYFLENGSKSPEERQSAAKILKFKPLKEDRKGLPESILAAFGISLSRKPRFNLGPTIQRRFRNESSKLASLCVLSVWAPLAPTTSPRPGAGGRCGRRRGSGWLAKLRHDLRALSQFNRSQQSPYWRLLRTVDSDHPVLEPYLPLAFLGQYPRQSRGLDYVSRSKRLERGR